MYQRVLFIGSKESGYNLLNIIFSNSPDSLVGCVTVDDSDDSRSKLTDFSTFCEANNITLNVLTGKCDISESIKMFNPDLCIVMGWYYIISSDNLDAVPGGFIGVHNSLLPKHRGFAPVVWTMIAGDDEAGFSVFSFDKGMDTGDIWYQGRVKIDNDDYIADVNSKLDKEISIFFSNNLTKILDGSLKPCKQSAIGISYGSKRTADDGRIDWSMNAKKIYDFIRAQSRPYPGAFTSYKGEKYIIWRANIFPYPIQGRSGQIGLIDRVSKTIVVVCGDNTGIEISHVETNGREINIIDVVKSLSYDFGV